MSQVVNICVILDDNYSVPTAVMLTSAKENKCADSHYKIYALTDRVSEYNINKIKSLDDKLFEIHIFEADVSKYKDITMKSHVSTAALLKFDIANILSDVDKVLYLDGDIIVRNDLSDFFNLNIEDKLLAGVRDMGGELMFNLHTIVGCEKYINSGVMLLNLKRMRNNNIPETLIEKKLNEPKDWKMADQNIFNLVCHKETMYLPPKYNCTVAIYRDRYRYRYDINKVNKFYEIHYECIEELFEDAVILHLAGEPLQRPWKHWNGVYSRTWNKYYDLSPYHGIDLDLVANQRHLIEPGRYTTNSAVNIYLMLNSKKLMWRYYRYKILAALTTGKMKKRYNEKKKTLKSSIRSMRNFRNFMKSKLPFSFM